MEYKGFEIMVRPSFVVLGENPAGEATEGYFADVRKAAEVQDDPDGRTLYDFPFDHMDSSLRGASEEEVVERAKAFVDGLGKPKAL